MQGILDRGLSLEYKQEVTVEHEFIKSFKSKLYGPLSNNQTCIPPGRWEKVWLHLAGKGDEELQKAQGV